MELTRRQVMIGAAAAGVAASIGGKASAKGAAPAIAC